MRQKLTTPRPDHIAELTRDIHLPLPQIPEVFLQIIAGSIHKAFCELKMAYPIIVSGIEDEVTSLIEMKLNNMISEGPPLSSLVSNVVRGRETLSFDGSHLKKEPDLSIYLAEGTRNFPLTVEAKLIDSAKSKTEVLYCDNGIIRFTSGEYAWANREAFMLAYVRDGSTIDSRLTPFLQKGIEENSNLYYTTDLPSPIVGRSMDLAISRHSRTFQYIGRTPPNNQPGSIAVWHLWLE